MKAITIHQPWAWAILHAGKTIENRSQCTSYRGPLAIHAGLKWSDRGAEFMDRFHGAEAWIRDEHGPVQIRGAVIGVVDLVDCHPDAGCCRPWGQSSNSHAKTLTHLVLENPRALADPIPARGYQSLWNVPPEVVELLAAQIGPL